MNRRFGEIIMVVSGIGLAIAASLMNITSLAYGGLAISGLGVISILWK